MPALNNVQLEILKLFKHERSEEELLEIKQLLSDYLFDKAVSMADKVHEEKGYTDEEIQQWKQEHTRISQHVNEGGN